MAEDDEETNADGEDDDVDADGAGAKGAVAEKKDSEWLPSPSPLC
jgi:hypothetical protein